jgi:hypothetical protein
VRNFKAIIQRLRASVQPRTAKKPVASQSNHKHTCRWNESANKTELRLPEKSWRLIDRIYIGTNAAPAQANRDEFDEEFLERIDFFACLFGNMRIE